MPLIGSCRCWRVCHVATPLVVAVIVGGHFPAVGASELNILAGISTQQDDNLFRRSEGEELSEQIQSGYLGVNFDKSYSLQRLLLDAVISDNRFQNYDYLNYQGKNISASWLWSLTPSLTGRLSGSLNEQLNSFIDYDGTAKNIQKVNAENFEANWRVMGGWYLIGALRQQELNNSVIYFVAGDYTSQSAEYGIKYQFPSTSSLALVNATTEGEYANRVTSAVLQIDKGFTQIDSFAKFDWVLGGKSALSGRFGYRQREHDLYSDRDYDGSVGHAEYVWNPTGKLRVQATISQDLTSFQSSPPADLPLIVQGGDYFNSSYYLSRSISIVPAWQLSARVALNLRISKEVREFKGGYLQNVEMREDELSQAAVAISWAPLEHVKLSADLKQQERTSNVAQADFSSQAASVTLGLSF